MYVDSLACVRVKGGESERFMIDSGVKQGVSCPLGFSMYIYGCSDEEGEDGDGKEGGEIPGGRERVEITWHLVYR